MLLSHPAPGRKITSPYGWRTHPISGNRRHHNGTDYGGTFEVLAAGDGIVIKKGSNMDPNRGYGHSLTIKHDDNVETLYAHGKSASKFKVGDKIKKGDVVYTSGATGAATGPHLHFEVRINGRFVDPEKHINKEVNKPIPSTPIELPLVVVDGRLNKGTWRRIQTWLKKEWAYTGKIDGITGRLTYSALQRFLKAHWGYKGRIDGILGKLSWSAAQRWLKASHGYTGRIDGIAGPLTNSALQRFANTVQKDGTLQSNSVVNVLPKISEPETELSEELTEHGIDVSHWQGKIDYKAYKASGGEFVIIKHSGANIGRLYVSDSINIHLNDARAAGLKIGFYYVVNGHMDIIEQAKFFVDNVKKVIQKDDIVVLDNESLDKGRAFNVNESLVWLSYVEKELNIKPFYYSYPALIKASDHTVIAENYPLWLAAFNKNNGTTEGGYEKHMAYWKKPNIWQYTSTGRITGYNANIDKNLSQKGIFDKYGYKG